MAKRLLKTLLLPLTVLTAAVAFIACDGETTTPDITFKVTYEIGADATGTAPTETNKAAGEKFKIKSADGITCVGMEFTGWSDGSLTYNVGDTYTMPSKAVTFTAQWEPADTPATYSVTYDLNGGTGETPAASYKGATEKFNLASADGFSYEGKEFDGWNDGENTYDAGAEYTMSGKPVVFTAQWKDEDLPDYLFAATELDSKGYIFFCEDGTGLLDYYSESKDDYVKANFTYTQDGAAIEVTIGGSTFNGTYDGRVLTLQFTYAGTRFKFGPQQEQPTGKPTVAFDANGGTGTAPVIADANITYDSNAGKYKFTLPQNTYTAPNGYEFDKWAVNGDNNTYRAGQTYFANAGEKLTLKALWKEVADDTPTGTEYFGNCHIFDNSPLTPVDVYVKAIMFDVAKGTMYYRIDDSLTYKKSRSVINQDSDSDKPSDYGANAKFYEVIIEGKALKLLLDVGNKLKLYNTSYEAYTNGEFNILVLNPTEYTVTFDPNNEEEAWNVTVSSIGIVQKPQTDPVHPNGKAFRYWKDSETGAEYIFGSAPTGNITLEAVYAWKVTYSAGEGTGTIDSVYVNEWTMLNRIILPDASDLSNGSKIFAGWWDGTYDESDPTVKNIYQPGEYYLDSRNGNVDFVAQWKVDNSYVLGFVKAVKYSDRSKVTGSDPEMPAKIEAGTTFAAPANTYTLAGCEFDGWELHEFSADSTLGAKLGDYAVGEMITMPAKPVQLVAKWIEVKTTATVTYKAGAHGTGADVVKTNVKFSTTYKLIDNPFTVENFYMFTGWKVEGDDSDSAPLTDKYNLTDDVVFVAQYANAYSNYDNDGTAAIVLYFDSSIGILYYGEDDNGDPYEVWFDIDVDGNDIMLTADEGEGLGTFVNNTLNIEITVGSTTFTFGNPNALEIGAKYRGTYEGTKDDVTYVLTIGSDSVSLKIDDVDAVVVVNSYDDIDGLTISIDGNEYTISQRTYEEDKLSQIYLMSSDYSLAVTLTRVTTITWANFSVSDAELINKINNAGGSLNLYFENSFVLQNSAKTKEYTFYGFQFTVVSGQIKITPIYAENVNGEPGTVKISGNLTYNTSFGGEDMTEDGKQLYYRSSSYEVGLKKTTDNDIYVSMFVYSTNSPTTLPIKLVEQNPNE